MGLYVVQSKTASGAIGVQIWEKIRGRRELVAHIGSAHTPGELAALIEIAKQRIHADQHELELGLEDRASALIDLPGPFPSWWTLRDER